MLCPRTQVFFFDQKLDHFNLNDRRTFAQRYKAFVRLDSNWVFLEIGGESQMKGNSCLAGFGRFSYFNLEHRFYGESVPPGPLRESITLLNTRQAVADLRSFIQAMNNRYRWRHPKWLVYGCSYAGALAAWLRQKHPDVVVGAVAGSAPLQAIFDYSEFLETVLNTMKTFDKSGFRTFEKLESEYQSLTNLTESFENISSSPFETDSPLPPKECTVSPVIDNAVRAVLNGHLKQFYASIKDVSSAEFLNKFGSSDSGKLEEDKQHEFWMHQRCTEFGFWQTKNSRVARQRLKNTAALTLKCYIRQCEKFYHSIGLPDFYSAERNIIGVDDTNALFGGNTNYTGSNVVFLNSEHDPWHSLSILEPPNDEVHTFLSVGHAHCHFAEEHVRAYRTFARKWLEK
ncbi:serine carboxypeptidase s28 domain-containing protein [Ditylenchus destructor]|nr:serine carboxypeptidase s28 domain-containing protein [Ditylenchus destructor]